MVVLVLIIVLVLVLSVADAFSPGGSSTLVNISPAVDRSDVYAMCEWATNHGGIQQAMGVGVTTYDGCDYFQATQADIPAGACVTYVPSDLVISSSRASREFGQTLSSCEKRLTKSGASADALPLFRIFFKILAEYERGDQSPWFPWLDSLPKSYNNGASMTYECFDILPPYASYCAMVDRLNFLNFQKAVRPLGGPSEAPFGPNVLDDGEVLKWAYNVARTRSIEADGGEFYRGFWIARSRNEVVIANIHRSKIYGSSPPVATDPIVLPQSASSRRCATCSITARIRRWRYGTIRIPATATHTP
jgi:hypothetical protein